MERITLKAFNTAIEAHIIKNSLESEGIACFILDENIVTLDPMLNFAVGGVRLQVNKEDEAKAKEILQKIDNQPFTDEESKVIKCPNCGSPDLYSDYKSMKDAKGVIAIIVAFLMSAFPLYAKSVFKCKACNTEFDKE